MNKEKTHCLSSRGFTLIELLIVIAIIAILAAMLLPTLNRAQEAGRTAVCKGNLHQYALALQMYVEDFTVYPPNGPSFSNETGTSWWGQRLQSYTGGDKLINLFHPVFIIGKNRL